jgi:4-amino-4-deoxy-L-arabinose transferase-like glycosyltransferase
VEAATVPPGAAPARERRSTRSRRALAPILLAIGLLASLPYLVHPWYEAGPETNDDSMYIETARSMLRGEGYSYLGQPFIIRPPGFPALLAPVLALRGVDFRSLNLFVATFGAAAVVLLFLFARPRVGTSVALALAALVWLNPGFRRFSNEIMSDVPGAALLFACLLLERWARRSPGPRRDAVLGVAIGLAAYVRSISILLVPAILVARWLRFLRREDGSPSWPRFVRDRALVLALVPALLLMPWSIRSALHHPETPVDQVFLYSYSTAMWHQDAGDPSSPARGLPEVLRSVPLRSQQTLAAIGGRMKPGASGPIEIAVGVSMLLASAFVLVRRRGPAEVFGFLTLGVLLVYFGFRDRLVLPIWMIASCGAAEALCLGLRRLAGERRAGLLASLCVLSVAALDFRPREGWPEIEAEHARRRALAAAWNASLPAGARVAAPIGWHWTVYLGRPVYSLFFGWRRASGHDGAERVIDLRGVDTVLLRTDPPEDPMMLAYFTSRYGVAKRVEGGVVVRVRP